jgi:alpha-L-rhamnosidase
MFKYPPFRGRAMGPLLLLTLASMLPFAAVTAVASERLAAAEWIVHPQESTSQNLWLVYRHTLVLDAAPAGPVPVQIAVDSKYWLTLNGELVVFEGGLKRGPNPRDTYVDVVDLGPHLRAGDNAIEILVWFWGREGFSHKNSGRAGLYVASQEPSVPLATGPGWMVARHPAYYTTEKENPNYRLPEFNVAYDARRAAPALFEWHEAETAGAPPVAPWNRLVQRPIPLWRDSGLVPYESTVVERSPEALIVRGRLPANLSITPWFRLRAKTAGGTVDMRTDNYIGGSEPNLRGEYITVAGEQSYESIGYLNGHEVIYRFPPDVEVLGVQYRETRYNADYVGRFVSGHADLDLLWRKCAYTLNVNLRDAIQDPDRERAQWWGDVVIILGEIFYVLDSEAGPAAVAKALRNLFDWQKPDGVLFSPVPAGNWDKELPSQMLHSLGHWGLERYHQFTGDAALVAEVWPAMVRYLDLWRTDERGHVVHRPGGWSWYDWGGGIDVPLLDQLWLYQAWESAARLGRVIGRDREAERFDRLAAELRAVIRRDFWRGDRFVSENYDGPFDDRANGLAVALGLVDAAEWAKLREALFARRLSGPYMEKYVIEAFYRMGDHELGTKRMLERYEQMTASPVTTLWEGWVVGSGHYGGGSYNHGWSGWPLTFAAEYLAGLKPLAPAYATIGLAPRLDGFERLDFEAPLAGNHLRMTFRRTAAGEVYRVQLNRPAPLVFTMPAESLAKVEAIRVDGASVPVSSLARIASGDFELRLERRAFLIEIPFAFPP